MITPIDIEILKDTFATKEDFAILEQKLDRSLAVTDKFMKEIIHNRQELTSLNYNVTTIKKWVKPVSSKTGIDYPF